MVTSGRGVPARAPEDVETQRRFEAARPGSDSDQVRKFREAARTLDAAKTRWREQWNGGLDHEDRDR